MLGKQQRQGHCHSQVDDTVQPPSVCAHQVCADKEAVKQYDSGEDKCLERMSAVVYKFSGKILTSNN